jgi:hypothetical protein
MNAKQILSISLVVLGVLTASAAQLTDIVGPAYAKIIISASSMIMSTLAGVQGLISGQSSLVKDVQAMPGVEKIVVNKDANASLATLAIDPDQQKIEVKSGAESVVNATAAAAA